MANNMSKRQRLAHYKQVNEANPLKGLDPAQAKQWVDDQLQGVTSVAQLRQALQDVLGAMAQFMAISFTDRLDDE